MIDHYQEAPKKGGVSITRQPAIGNGSDALEYIKKLKDKQDLYREKSKMNVYQSPPISNKKERRSNLNYRAENIDPQSESETWQRVPIIPGVELFLRLPAETDINSRVQQLIIFAKKLFNQF